MKITYISIIIFKAMWLCVEINRFIRYMKGFVA